MGVGYASKRRRMALPLAHTNLEYNVPDPAIALEKLFDISVPSVLRNVPKVHFVVSRHLVSHRYPSAVLTD